MILSLFGILLLCLAIGMPIAACVGMGIICTLLIFEQNTSYMIIAQRMFTSLDSFTFLAVPFFILSGNLMDRGGISKRLIYLATNLIRGIPAAMASVTTVTSAFFGAISGSNPATVAAIGGITAPEMKRRGYPAEYAGAVAASSGTLGVIIPPSIPMVTYSVVAGVSTGTMFLGGVVPGILLAVAMCTVNVITCGKFENKNIPLPADNTASGYDINGKLTFRGFLDSFWALMFPVIILGGIYGGIFTPTEAAAVSCAYAFIISTFVYKELKVSELKGIAIKTAMSTALCMFVCSMSSPFSWYMTSAGIANKISSAVLGFFNSKVIILIIVNCILLFLGCFIETQSIIMLMTPILAPIALGLGMDLISLGIIIVVNTSIGMITPPMAVNLFVASEVAETTIEKISRRILPYLFAECIVLFLITYWNDVILFIPRMAGMA